MLREWWLLVLLLGAALVLTLAYALPRKAYLSAALPPAALPQQGFHAVERMGVDEQGMPFRWSEGEALLRLPNPGYGPLRLRMLLTAPPPGRTTPLELRRDRWATPPLSVTAQARFYSLLLPPEHLRERIDLAIETDSFREDLGRSKERRLGIMFATLEMAGPQGGTPPRGLLALLLAACVAGYALLRRANWRPPVAALSLLLGALALCALQASWAWQWGLTGRLLGMLTLGALAALTLDLWLARQAFTRVPTFSRSLAPSGGVAQERGRRRNREGLVRGQGMASADLRLAGADALALGAVLALALALRLPWVTAPDPVGDLELSARRAATLAAEGLAGAYAGGGGNDYLPLRLYLLWGMGLLARSLGLMLDSPLSPGAAWLMKLPWLLADLATTALLYLWSRRRARLRGAALIALAYAAMPQIWLNVAWWGQVDALLVLLMLGALLLLIRAATQGGHGLAGAWFVLGCALLVKLQAIILLPLLGLLTLRLWRLAGLLRGATMLGVTLGLGMLPLVLAGQTPGLLEAYLGSVGRFNGVTINAFNIWYFVAPGVYVPDTEPWALGLSYRQIGVVLLGMAALLIGLLAALRVPATWPAHWLEAAALTALAFFLLPTQIHERYLYLCFAFLAARLASAPALWLPFLLLSLSATVNVFGTLDFWPALRAYLAVPWIGKSLALLNLLVFVGLLLHLGGLAPRQRLRTGLVKA